jgi:lysozyme family protein
VNALQTKERLQEDGVIGGKTLEAIRAVDPMKYYAQLCELSAAHYRHIAMVNPEQAENLRGWLKRAEA